MLSSVDPGWFSDVLEVKIDLESAHLATGTPITLFQPSCPLYAFGDTISGKISVTPLSSSTVWQKGITVTLECCVNFFESFTSHDIFSEEIEVAKESYISEKTEFDFSFDTNTFVNKLLDSCDGELLSIRYNVVAKVKRPWWTFEILEYTAFVLNRCRVSPAPKDDELDDIGRAIIEVAGSEAPISKELAIRDIEGKCRFLLDKTFFNIGEEFSGQLLIDRKILKNIAKAEIIFYKIEYGDAEEFEQFLHEHTLDLNSESEETINSAPSITGKKNPSASMDEQGDVQSSSRGEVQSKDSQEDLISFPVKFLLRSTNYCLCPSMATKVGEDKELVALRYFIRLLITDKQSKKHWNTNEVLLYRAKLETSSSSLSV